MFSLIRNAILLCLLAMLVAVGFLLYQNPHRLDPAIEWIQIYRHREADRRKITGEINGRVVRVVDGNTLTIRQPPGILYNIRMTGILVPDPQAAGGPARRALAAETRNTLSRFALSHEVRVDVTLVTSNLVGLGTIYVGGTNVASVLLGAGLATTDAKHLEAVPTTVQLELLKSERRARENQVGVWAPTATSR